MGPLDPDRAVVSVNGSDDELALLASTRPAVNVTVATAVGTYRYKALDDAVRVFDMLRAQGVVREFHIFGNPDWVPRSVRRAAHVHVRGNLPRADLIEWLRGSRLYLSTTRIENSYNAASEGVFSAEESYLSDIGPHRELLAGAPVRRMRVAGVNEGLIHVRRADVDPAPLKTWDTVIREMLARFESARPGESR
jgi:glycosyltransferase involved in cell wall biosynthesis